MKLVYFIFMQINTTIIMFTKFCFAVLLLVCTMGCNDSNKKEGNSKLSTAKKKEDAVADSYTTDTLYQNAPALLTDVTASVNLQELLAQNWILDDDKAELDLATDEGIEMPIRSFSMATDFTLVKNVRNAMETGTWKFDADKKILTFKYAEGGSDVYKLRALAADEMKLTNVGIGSETVLTFVSDGKKYKNKTDDPFYIANNRWRIQPGAAENDAAIKERLKQNLHFFILYYRDAVARRAGAVSFYGLPSCLQWYAGQINLQNKKTLSKKWKECFYNEAQALKAYALMEVVIGKNIKWPSGKTNWLKKNLSALEQMYTYL